MITVPEFLNQKELYSWLVSNKKTLESQKKFQVKQADAVILQPTVKNITKFGADKAEINESDLIVKLVINTTNWIDSHSDVHIPGLWRKSLTETKALYLLQEHKMEFGKIISDDVAATVENYSFRELGYDISGTTQALIFNTTIKANRNPFMFNQYKNGWVKNHSVGMRYVKMIMCIDDADYGAEFEAWEKYYPMVANKEQCKEKGYFWAITEAKLIEGSAVPIGSNEVTPVISLNEKAANGTFDADIEPLISTQKKTSVNWANIANCIN